MAIVVVRWECILMDCLSGISMRTVAKHWIKSQMQYFMPMAFDC